MRIKLQDRLWAAFAHVPIITIIWTGYLLYCKLFQEYEYTTLLVRCKAFDWRVLPITPILLTLLSVPIALGIQRMQRAFPLARNNAHEAYVFSIWLLQVYGKTALTTTTNLVA